MSELTATFTCLHGIYHGLWPVTTHAGQTRVKLMQSFALWQGVYIIYRNAANEPLYVGSAGKLERGADGVEVSGQTVRQRLFASTTPYTFDRCADVWRYGPTTSGVPPVGYHFQVPVSDLRIESFHVPDTQAPSVLEHLLLQGCVNQFGNLPVANQKF